MVSIKQTIAEPETWYDKTELSIWKEILMQI